MSIDGEKDIDGEEARREKEVSELVNKLRNSQSSQDILNLLDKTEIIELEKQIKENLGTEQSEERISKKEGNNFLEKHKTLIQIFKTLNDQLEENIGKARKKEEYEELTLPEDIIDTILDSKETRDDMFKIRVNIKNLYETHTLEQQKSINNYLLAEFDLFSEKK